MVLKQGKFDLVSGDISTLHTEAGPAPLALRANTGHANERRAKIICTVGPASNSEAILRDLLRLGMDVARLNFSHGTHEDHARNIERIRRAARKEGRTVCILQDLQGPKIRTGRLKSHEPILLKTGSRPP
jgi:pyruvate kinase